jgi:hypothetical protein
LIAASIGNAIEVGRPHDLRPRAPAGDNRGVTEQSSTPADDERDRKTFVPAPAPRRRVPRRAVRRGTEREDISGVPADEGGRRETNDERLRQDVPPHW